MKCSLSSIRTRHLSLVWRNNQSQPPEPRRRIQTGKKPTRQAIIEPCIRSAGDRRYFGREQTHVLGSGIAPGLDGCCSTGLTAGGLANTASTHEMSTDADFMLGQRRRRWPNKTMYQHWYIVLCLGCRAMTNGSNCGLEK